MATAALHPTPAHKPETTSLPSTSSTTLPPPPFGTVTASLNFYEPPADGSKPHNYVEIPIDGRPQRNFGAQSISVPINDIRGHERTFTLDANAFAVLRNIPEHTPKDWTSDASIKEHYYPEVEKLLLENVPGAHRVILFDHTVRLSSPNAHRSPVQRVHIDQTPQSAKQRVYQHASSPSDAEELLKGRYRIINVWRPLREAVYTSPLAVCDSATVREDDLVPVEHRYPDRTGETAAVRYSEGQRWWYWSGMGPAERLLLECFDSEREGGRVPHTAFKDPREQDGWPGRESIEVRALVFG